MAVLSWRGEVDFLHLFFALSIFNNYNKCQILIEQLRTVNEQLKEQKKNLKKNDLHANLRQPVKIQKDYDKNTKIKTENFLTRHYLKLNFSELISLSGLFYLNLTPRFLYKAKYLTRTLCSSLGVIWSGVMVIRRIFSKSYQTYKQALDDAFNRKNLIYTNILISMGISVTGDVSEQTYECYYTNEIESYDFNRTGQMAITGFTAGILCHHWYNFLDRVVVGKTVYMVIKKLFLDQFICSPMLLLSFFATVAILEDNPIENFTGEVSQKFWILYKAEWVVWPPAQIINFYFLPTQYRVLYDSIISLGYDIYASHVKHAKLD